MSPSPLQWINSSEHHEAHIQHQLARAEVAKITDDFELLVDKVGRPLALRIFKDAKRDLFLAEQRHWGQFHGRGEAA